MSAPLCHDEPCFIPFRMKPKRIITKRKVEI